MSTSRRKTLRRKVWGSARTRARNRFAKGDYEIEPEWLDPKDSWNSYAQYWSKREWRWMLKNQHKRWARQPDVVASVLSWMPMSEKFEEQYGIFMERCSKCHEKIGALGRSTFVNEKWVCYRCERKVENEQKERRSRELAYALLPQDFVEEIEEHGYSIKKACGRHFRVTKHGKVTDNEWGFEYNIDNTQPRLNGWDRIIQVWLTLKYRPQRIIEAGRKTV